MDKSVEKMLTKVSVTFLSIGTVIMVLLILQTQKTCISPHNLPFFDGVFDFAFTAHLGEALFPWRFVEEMERTVRHGGFCLVAVDECGDDDVRDIARFFPNSKLVDVANVTLEGYKKTSVLFKVQDFPT